jgi:nickel/cobalt transporter (NicO) family protein
MVEFSALVQQGNAWLFIPSAVALGALHGLEPGHSKTMMAAFIVAVRGTVGQAVVLGLSATLSHTAVVWAVAMAGLYFGRSWDAQGAEPYFEVVSAALMIGIATWMLWRVWHNQSSCGHDHGGGRGDDHEEARSIDTGHGLLRLELFANGQASRFRLHGESRQGHRWPADQVRVETDRPDGGRQVFSFVQRDSFFESTQDVPEPHEFIARLSLGHGHHVHNYDVEFVEHAHPHHVVREYDRLDIAAPGYQDPHELAHANDIRYRFANRQVTNGQIVMFGLTGGLIPCPASVTVLLLCLQLKKITLGATLVLCFSVGLALTMVASGTLAALSVKHVSRQWSGFGELARKAPYLSGLMILLVGIYVGFQGLTALP